MGGTVFGRRNNQGCTGIVDQNAVGFIDQEKIGLPVNGTRRRRLGNVALGTVPKLSLFLFSLHRMIAEEIKSKFLHRAVGNIALIGCTSLLARHFRLYDTDGQAQRSVNGLHPRRVSLGEVIIARRQQSATTRKGMHK